MSVLYHPAGRTTRHRHPSLSGHWFRNVGNAGLTGCSKSLPRMQPSSFSAATGACLSLHAPKRDKRHALAPETFLLSCVCHAWVAASYTSLHSVWYTLQLVSLVPFNLALLNLECISLFRYVEAMEKHCPQHLKDAFIFHIQRDNKTPFFFFFY